MFSVIIPLFNKTEHIEKCLQSVFNQTFQDFEVIVVNDGSTDDGEGKVHRIIKQYAHTLSNNSCHISLINQPNLGVSSARNNGVKAAKYDFIAFLDADDWWEPPYLKELNNLINDYPEGAIYSCGYYLVKNGKKLRAQIGIESDFEMGIINYSQVYAKNLCMPIWTGATIIRKSVFLSEGGFKLALKLGEDFDLWIRIALKYPVVFLNKTLANYNQNVNLKTRGVSRNLLDKENYFTFQLTYLEEFEKNDNNLKKLLDNLRVVSLEHYYIKRKYMAEVNKIIKKVDFSYIPRKIALTYELPFIISFFRYYLIRIASYLKRFNSMNPNKLKNDLSA